MRRSGDAQWRTHDPRLPPQPAARPADRRQRARHDHHRRARARVPRCLRRCGGVVPRPCPSRRAGRDARADRQAGLRAHQLLHAPRWPRRWPTSSSAPRRPGTSHAYLVSGGSEAMEAALKMARQYFVEIGQPQRTRFIARRQSYHGNTLGALSVGGNAWRREPFAPMLIEASHVSPCYAYREQRAERNARVVRPAPGAGARRRPFATSAASASSPSSPKPSAAPPPAC